MSNYKRSIIWDALGTTLFGILFLWGIYAFSTTKFGNLDIINPISETFKDFEMTDLVFSKIRESPPVDQRIVLVNIGNLDKLGIAEEVKIISSYKPKVIGIDVRFTRPPGDSEAVVIDSILASAFKNAGNVVLGCELIANKEEGKIDSIQYALPIFNRVTTPAYVNMIAEGLTEFNTSRDIFLRQKLADSSYMLSFAAQIANKYKPSCIKKIEERNKDTEIINYYGNINTVDKNGPSNAKITFGALDCEDVLNTEDPEFNKAKEEMIKGNIVVMGFMGENFQTYSTQDRFFTPLNDRYVGRANQDMYGVVVHANIIAMILNENYIDEMPENWTFVMNVLIIFLNIIFFQYLFSKLELFWDGATLLITLLQALLFSFVIVYIFSKFNYKLDFGLATLALFLMPNIIELYYGLIKPTIIKIIDKIESRKKRKIVVNPEE